LEKEITMKNCILAVAAVAAALFIPLQAAGRKNLTGRVLFAGGIDNNTNAAGYHPGLSSAEVYEEQRQQFISTGSMNEGRVGHTATVLKSGAVLVAGGDGAETDHPVASAELYDPQTGVFHQTGSMSVARVAHTATLLGNGLVLVAGGQVYKSRNGRGV
jgi:hypothetical protein